jgi:opacity protein-like surface antigen
MSPSKFALTAAFCTTLLASPGIASADWILTPFIGANFSGSADVNDPTTQTSFTNKFNRKLDYGLSLATMGEGAVGFELDFGYSPNFFEVGSTSDNTITFTNDSNVTTLTGNLIVGGHRGAVRPYAVGGIGLIRTNVQDIGKFFDVNTKNDFGFDLGAGVIGFFSDNVGLRGDVRYFRSFQGSSSNATGLALSNFHYARATLGVAFKF